MDSSARPHCLAGRFIVFEGGDSTGKSTHLRLLAKRLRAERCVDLPGRPGLVVTREPGGTELGAQIRQLLLHGGQVAASAEALLYAADRAQHVAQVLRPALARGDLVISDRYLDSSIAYQAEGRGLDEGVIREVNAVATGGLEPDLTILLDISAGAATARRDRPGAARDRLESAGSAFHADVNRRYRELAAVNPERYVVISTADSKDAVHERVWAAVRPLVSVLGPATRAPGESRTEVAG
ncbi:MAG: dTMP kinase [Bifidobacteriaceae bacterium]|jgi:dTMP kinase|nr:dTMP kinase [Bifidobacteriaceae bacterium]